MMLRSRTAGGAMAALLLLVSVVAAGPQKNTPPDRVRLASGQKLLLELQTPLNTTTAREGDRVIFVTAREVELDGKVVIPKGSQVAGTVTKVKAARNSKRAEVEFRLDSFQFEDGTRLPIDAATINAKSDDKSVGGGGGFINGIQRAAGQAAQGGMLGMLLGGGRKGGLIGAAMGAGAEMAGQIASKTKKSNSELDLPQGAIFDTKLNRALDVPIRITSLPPATLPNPAPGSPAGPSPASGGAIVSVNAPEAGRTRNDGPDTGRPRNEDAPILLEGRGPEHVKGAPPSDPADPVSVSAVPPLIASSAASIPSAPVPIIAVDAEPAPIAAVNAPDPVVGAVDAPPDVQFRVSVNVSLAQIDAVVRDRAGRPIDNLRITDFRMFEDGVERPIQTFSKDELPLAIALVVDRSGSVAPFMDRIQKAAYQALSLLKRGDSACLFAFAGNTQMIEGLTTDLQRVANSVGTLRVQGGTDIPIAIHTATDYLARTAPDKRRAVILISDNEQAQRMEVSVNQTVQLALRSETVVYSVKMDAAGGGSPLPLLIPTISFPGTNRVMGNPVPEIAKETGGEVFEVSSSGSIEKALSTAIGRLKVRYTLGYNPSEEGGGYRKVEIRLVERFGRPNSDYTILARSGQYNEQPASTRRK